MQIATIKPDGLKLHKGPGSTYRVIDVLSKTDSLTVLAREGCWAQVRVARSKQVGWVYGPDLTITDHFTGAHGPAPSEPASRPQYPEHHGPVMVEIPWYMEISLGWWITGGLIITGIIVLLVRASS